MTDDLQRLADLVLEHFKPTAEEHRQLALAALAGVRKGMDEGDFLLILMALNEVELHLRAPDGKKQVKWPDWLKPKT